MTTTIRRHLRLTAVLCSAGLHRLTAYRMDFLIGAASFVIRIACQIALISVIFQYTPSLGGWTQQQAMFLLGFSLLPRGIDRLFTDQLWILAWQLVRTGDFFRYLIKPVNPFYSLLSERFLYPDGFGELATGIAIVLTASSLMDLELSVVQWLLLLPLVLCGALIHTFVKAFLASLSFWMTSSLNVMVAVNQLGEFSAYPLNLYHPVLRGLLTWVLPFAFTAYIPARYLLTGETGLLLWTGPVTAVTVGLGYGAFLLGVRRYEMPGN